MLADSGQHLLPAASCKPLNGRIHSLSAKFMAKQELPGVLLRGRGAGGGANAITSTPS